MSNSLPEMRKKAMRTVKTYAAIAATIAFLFALDPEPISGTFLIVFADTPLLTIVTFTMVVHLCFYYGQKNILTDGILTTAAISFGTVAGSLGAMILGGLIPGAKTINNAVVTYGLHYATGRAIISCLENGIDIKTLSVSKFRKMIKPYKKEGESLGKVVAEAQSKMSEEDKEKLKELNGEVKSLSKELSFEIKKETKDGDHIEELTKRIDAVGEEISKLYEKYGVPSDES